MPSDKRVLNILKKNHGTNEEDRKKIKSAIGEYDELITMVKKRKRRWFGYVLTSFWFSKDHSTGHSKRKRSGRKKENNI